MQKITPCLWFNHNGHEAVEFYKTVFKDNCKVLDQTYYNDANPYAKPGDILTVDFEIFGQQFTALNGGPDFPFTDAVSFMIDCKDQTEIDYYWDAFLNSGGKAEQCGWVRDKYGLAWQIAPRAMDKMFKDPNSAKAKAAMAAMMDMIKIDMAEIQRAYDEA